MNERSTIVVGVDGSAGSRGALRWASERASDATTRIVAAHVLTYDAQLFNDLPPVGMTNWRRDIEDHLRGPWTDDARGAGVEISTVVEEGDDVAHGLLKVAEREHADLVVVVGAHHPERHHTHLGRTVAGAVVRDCPVPVTVVPDRT